MQKNILIAAVAATLTSLPMLSSAATLSAKGVEFDVFGKLQAELSSIDIDPDPADPTQPDDAQLDVRDSGVQSRIGFDFKKDFGGGLAAIGRLEYTAVLGDGGSPSAREQWVGLKGGWGEFNAGHNQAPMKYIGGAAYDIFVATALQARGSGGAMWAPGSGLGASGFVGHSIKYRTPKGAPIAVHALIMPSDSLNSGEGAEIGGPGNGVDYNVGASWGGDLGEIVLGVSQDTANDAQEFAGYDDETVVRVAGKLNLGAFTLMAQYEDIGDALSAGGVGANGTFDRKNACSGGSGFRGGEADLYPAGAGQCNTAMNPGGDGEVYFAAVHWKLGKWLLVAQGGKTEADETAARAGIVGPPAIPAIAAQIDREATNGTFGVVYFFDKTTRIYGGYQTVSVEESRSDADSTKIEPDRESIALGIRLDF